MNAALKTQVIISQEPFTDDLCAEMLPMAQENWVRSESFTSDRPLDPAVSKYKMLEKSGSMTTVTARRQGTLVGYLVFFDHFSLHHQTLHVAHGDLVFVMDDRDLRYAAAALLALAESILTEKKVEFSGWFCKPGSILHKFLLARGYQDDEILVEKRLYVPRN